MGKIELFRGISHTMDKESYLYQTLFVKDRGHRFSVYESGPVDALVEAAEEIIEKQDNGDDYILVWIFDSLDKLRAALAEFKGGSDVGNG